MGDEMPPLLTDGRQDWEGPGGGGGGGGGLSWSSGLGGGV